jgi:hypothetical protein
VRHVTPLIRVKDGWLLVEVPRHSLWSQSIRASIWNTGRLVTGVWWFPLACYSPVLEITRHYFPSVRDLSRLDSSQLVPPDGWRDRWERFLSRSETTTRMDSPSACPYGVLHLQPEAPFEVVQAAYRALSKLHHPDAGGDAERMQQINAAYWILKERATA